MRTSIALRAGAVLLAATTSCATTDEPGSFHPTPDGGGTSRVEPTSTTLEGTVRGGVEGDCLLLRSGGRAYLLLGPQAEGLSPGERIRVSGTERPDLATSCMEGVPFRVETVDRTP